MELNYLPFKALFLVVALAKIYLAYGFSLHAEERRLSESGSDDSIKPRNSDMNSFFCEHYDPICVKSANSDLTRNAKDDCHTYRKQCNSSSACLTTWKIRNSINSSSNKSVSFVNNEDNYTHPSGHEVVFMDCFPDDSETFHENCQENACIGTIQSIIT